MRLVDYGAVAADREHGKWSPLKITALMGEPVIYLEDGLHLDGILAFGAFVEYRRERAEDDLPPITSPWAEDFDLPLAKWACRTELTGREDPRLLTPDGQVWGWCASAAVADWRGRGKMEYRKRPAVEQFKRFTRDKTYHSSLGPTKAFDLAYPTLHAHEVTWYALGDRERVADLLGNVPSIGKRATTGMGKVLSWRVETMGQDWSIERDGVLMRRMPVGWRETLDWPDMQPIRAPYHHRSRRVVSLPIGVLDAAA